MERDDFNKALGKRIKTIRKVKGLTLLELGKAVGISESTAQRYEDGKIKSVSIDMVRKFSHALNTPLQSLMGWDKNTSIESPTKTEPSGYYTDPEVAQIAEELRTNPNGRILFDASKDLSKEDINVVLTVIEGLKRPKGGKDGNND